MMIIRMVGPGVLKWIYDLKVFYKYLGHQNIYNRSWKLFFCTIIFAAIFDDYDSSTTTSPLLSSPSSSPTPRPREN